MRLVTPLGDFTGRTTTPAPPTVTPQPLAIPPASARPQSPDYPQTAAPPQTNRRERPRCALSGTEIRAPFRGLGVGGLPHDTHPASDLHNSRLPEATFLFLEGELTPRSLRSLSLNAKNITAVPRKQSARKSNQPRSNIRLEFLKYSLNAFQNHEQSAGFRRISCCFLPLVP